VVNFARINQNYELSKDFSEKKIDNPSLSTSGILGNECIISNRIQVIKWWVPFAQSFDVISITYSDCTDYTVFSINLGPKYNNNKYKLLYQ